MSGGRVLINLQVVDEDGSSHSIGLFQDADGLADEVCVVAHGERQHLLRLLDGELTRPLAVPVRDELRDIDGDVDLVMVLLRHDSEPMVRYPMCVSALLPPHADGGGVVRDVALVGEWSPIGGEVFAIWQRWNRHWPDSLGQWRRVQGAARAAWFQAVKDHNFSLRRCYRPSAPSLMRLRGNHGGERAAALENGRVR